MLIFDTICGATKERQSDLIDLVREWSRCDRCHWENILPTIEKLAKLASSHDRPTFHIEASEDLIPTDFDSFRLSGVTAGASTPEFIIRKVCEKARRTLIKIWKNLYYPMFWLTVTRHPRWFSCGHPPVSNNGTRVLDCSYESSKRTRDQN